jgi:hypothetical protein
VARIEGLSDVMLNEMIEFPGGVFGLALNLEETEVGAILLGDNTKVSEGDEAKTTGRLLSVPGRARRCSVAWSTPSGNRSMARATDQIGNLLSAGENCPRGDQAPQRQSTGADRYHGD